MNEMQDKSSIRLKLWSLSAFSKVVDSCVYYGFRDTELIFVSVYTESFSPIYDFGFCLKICTAYLEELMLACYLCTGQLVFSLQEHATHCRCSVNRGLCFCLQSKLVLDDLFCGFLQSQQDQLNSKPIDTCHVLHE